MVACCVAWSRGPMPNQVACCVVGLWGCGVCVCVFCWPRGSQKAPKIIPMGHLLKLFRPILGQGGTKQDPKINRNKKQAKKRAGASTTSRPWTKKVDLPTHALRTDRPKAGFWDPGKFEGAPQIHLLSIDRRLWRPKCSLEGVPKRRSKNKRIMDRQIMFFDVKTIRNVLF